MLDGTDPERFAAAFAPTAVTVDHRKVNFGTLHGPEEPAAALAAFLELTKDVSWRLVDILDCRENAIVVRSSNVGKERLGGGAFERRLCSPILFDEAGLISRWEIFEDEDVALALTISLSLTSREAIRAATSQAPQVPPAKLRSLVGVRRLNSPT